MLIKGLNRELIQDIEVFKDLDYSCLDMLTKHLAMETYLKGDFIYKDKLPADHVYFLLEGRVKMGAYTTDGKEMIKSIVLPGMMFGEMAILKPEPRDHYALVLSNEIQVLSIASDKLKNIMNVHPKFMFNITKNLGKRLLNTEKRLTSLISKDVKSRIVELILDLGREVGKKVGDELLIKHQLTHQDFANLTATSRQTVTTVLNELREQHYIYFERKKILVHDPHALARAYELNFE